MSEPVEFDVPDAGAPSLEGREGVSQGPDAYAEAATALVPVPSWTAEEAAKVVGGLVANVTLAVYAFRYSAPPPSELWPQIAGRPELEFPLLGSGLAPVLDFIAPKGSAAAVGVSLTAGVGELIGAFARRASVLSTPPAKARSGPGPAPETNAPAAAPPEGGGFRFTGAELRVLEAQDQPLAGFGIE